MKDTRKLDLGPSVLSTVALKKVGGGLLSVLPMAATMEGGAGQLSPVSSVMTVKGTGRLALEKATQSTEGLALTLSKDSERPTASLPWVVMAHHRNVLSRERK